MRWAAYTRHVRVDHDMSGGLTACGVASAVLYPPSGVPPHHGTVQCRFVASCGDRGGIWNIMTSARTAAVLETEGPGASQPVSNIQQETGPRSSAEFPKAGF